jgi:hypothetical protein
MTTQVLSDSIVLALFCHGHNVAFRTHVIYALSVHATIGIIGMGGHSILSVDKHAWNAGAPVRV